MTIRIAIAVVAITGLLESAQTTAPRPVSTQVPVAEFVDITGSVSRDGRYLSFVGPKGLSVVDLASNQIRIVKVDDNVTSQPWNSSISRDAGLVAYSLHDTVAKRTSLWVANLTGDPKPRQICADAAIRSIVPRDWSPDGKWIAALISTTDFSHQLALVPAGGGAPRVLKTGRWSGSSRVFFSPDGRYLAYDLPDSRTNTRDIWITAVDLSKDRAVMTHRANDIVMGWTPDGTGLLFVSDRIGGNSLWSLPMRDGTPVRAPVFLKPDMGSSQSMGVTDSGALFAVTNYFRVGTIMVGTFDFMTGAVQVARDFSMDPGEDNVNPAWSPDGKYLAYVSWRSRPIEPLVVLRAADTGGVVAEIEPQMRDAGLADWHPDGKSLLMVGNDYEGNHGAFRVDVATGAASKLYAIPEKTPGLSWPAWSRDGRKLYYWNVTSAGEHVFIARDLRSGTETELVRRPFLGGILVSPDGARIATETLDLATKESGLLLIPLDGTAPRDLVRRPLGVRPSPLAWTSDSQALVSGLNATPGAPNELWLVPVDGSAPRKLSTMPDTNIFRFTVSLDGHRVAYRVKEAEMPPLPQVWKLEHFLSAPAGR